MTDLSNSLAGLSVLTGSNGFASLAAAGTPKIETRAQRTAKAAFTTPETIAPWKLTGSKAPAPTLATAVKAMKTIIDKPGTGAAALPTDVQTAFTSYRALDRLQALADSASKPTTSSAERTALQTAFAKGLADLKSYLATAPSDKMDLSYARAAREAQSVPVASPSSLTAATIAGKGVRDTRTGALDGVTGKEVLRIDLSQGGGIADSVTVDLSSTPQPPTLDGVADAINAAIRAIPKRDTSGNIVNDDSGNPVPRWAVSVEPTKTGDKWGLSVKRAGFETIAIDQVAGKDAIMVASGVANDSVVNGLTVKTPTETRITRFDDPASAFTRKTLGTIAAVDGAATERSAILADADKTDKTKAQTIAASTFANGIATDSQGFSYVVGTTAGNVGGNLSHGDDDLFLTKVDSEGTVVWQRNLGAAGSASGAAVTIGPDGGIVVAASVKGGFDGANSDGDLAVARYDTLGNETFSTLVRTLGNQTASAVVVGKDGSIFVGGNDDKDAIVARIDATGKLQERRVIDSGGTDTLKALAIGSDGALVALTGEGGHAVIRRLDAGALTKTLGQLDLGRADARALAVADDGTIAVAGATDTALGGTQANTTVGGRDAFVARVDAGLSGAAVTYIGTGAEDQADSVSFLDGSIYVGGRTAGAFSGSKTGSVDAFVARVDASTGTVGSVSQFGTIGATAGAVRLSAIEGGSSVLGALGLHRGTLTPTDSVTLEAQTSLRAGDEFSIRVNNGALRKVTIGEGETLTTLADKIRKLAGITVANITTPSKGTGRALRIDLKPGQEIQLVAGSAGKDALVKLGLDAKRISAPPATDDDTPKVRPGGSFGLDLTDALRIDSKADATVALARIKQAVSYSQSAYRSLYWDDAKAALVSAPAGGSKKSGSVVVEKAQLANYQAALTRLSSTSTTSLGF